MFCFVCLFVCFFFFFSGGTLDVTVHAIQGDGTIKEIHKVTGGAYGGIKVNQQFETLLTELFGEETLKDYRQSHPSDWLTLMNEFEAKKRGERVLDEDVMINLRLTRSFATLVNNSQSRAMARYESRKIQLKNNEYLALSSDMMRELFSPTLQRIKDHLKGLLQDRKLANVKTMLLVGGFADSGLLQKKLKSIFSKSVKVLIPNNASIAVVQGAVLFGKKPDKITQRIVATTYGAGCSRNFIHGGHPESKKFIVDGVEKCQDLFHLFVKENSAVKIGEKVTCTYTPLQANDTNITFNFYSSSNPDSHFVTDIGMKKVGSFMVLSPDTWRGKNREIEVSMYFGRTEITASARDVSSGNTAQTTIDFLHK